MIEWFIQQIQTNEILAGLVGGSVFGYVLFAARELPVTLAKILFKSFTVSMQIDSRDEAYLGVNVWLSHHNLAQKVRRLKLISMWENNSYQWVLSCGYGYFLVRHDGKFLLVQREREKDEGAFSIETLTITTLGRSQRHIRELVEKARDFRKHEDMTPVKMWHRGWWRSLQPRRNRERDTLFFNEGILEGIENDLDHFLDSEEKYHRLGLPYRRAYLFYGIHGTGKTSLAAYLANRYRRALHIVSLNEIGGDSELLSLFSDLDPRATILLLEDVDTFAVVSNRETEKTPAVAAIAKLSSESDTVPQSSNLSLSGLLNALDGVVIPEGMITVMTTNHVEKLDPALFRTGRVDYKIEIPKLNDEAIKRAIKTFFPDAITDGITFTPKIASEVTGALAASRNYKEAIAKLETQHDARRAVG